METSNSPKPWSRWKLAGFRALLVYFVLFTFPFPLSYVPVIGDWVFAAWTAIQHAAAGWVANHLLGLGSELYTSPSGSGDRTVDYVIAMMSAVIALASALTWTLVDRKPRAYPRVARWLEIDCRLALAVIMISYGLIKVAALQMPQPGLTQLLTPLGELTPMGLVWTLMGVSPAYQAIAGAAEAIGGILLFWRRTRLLGATIIAIVMTNVVLLNYFYNVPVKLFSSHLLAMAIGLMLLDARRLLAIFVLNQPAPAADLAPLFAGHKAQIGAGALKLAFLSLVIGLEISQTIEGDRMFGNGRERHELWGIHDVVTFTQDGNELPPLLTDELRWKALIVDHALPIETQAWTSPGVVVVQGMDGTMEQYSVEFDDAAQTMTLSHGEEETVVGVLTFERSGRIGLLLTGEWFGSKVEIRLRERDLDGMHLTHRGFHWVNAVPN